MGTKAMKDSLGREAVTRLAQNIERVWPDFADKAFVAAACRGLGKLELKERAVHVAEALAAHLPDDYRAALEVIDRAAASWEAGDPDDALRGFAAWPLFFFVERHGVDDFDASMATLRRITHLFSAEGAVRPFIERYPKRAHRELGRWSRDRDEHVRRLVSEGMRPRLPWAARIPALIEDPAPVLSLLERLKDDPARYVQRSVANNLNDISKDHPELVVETCRRWSRDAGEGRRWIIGHGLRTLIKRSHPGALELMGYGSRPRVRLQDVRITPRRVRLGADLRLSFGLESEAQGEQALLVDYAVHYVKANGSLSPKVFKLRKLKLAAGAQRELQATISFAPISTRRYWPGTHRVELRINGAPYPLGDFELVES
ncbi:MAG: DNA alkylation repair protein [Myxococcales bacterium]|nr:DNA alkylation repair protein [Myxococcales bacterium]